MVTEVTNEPIFDVPGSMQQQLSGPEHNIGEVKTELVAMGGQTGSIRTDITTICPVPVRHEDRFDRIEPRLEPHELAETQRPYEPK